MSSTTLAMILVIKQAENSNTFDIISFIFYIR
jgi:hypothetical protein